ncbi:Lactonase, 7-bladed beta-propeller-domain-containing protein [Melampsora americana]|nr:Lactonase, 7-bladed beta-propeller-domain-containing protein [Melampsora americana]
MRSRSKMYLVKFAILFLSHLSQMMLNKSMKIPSTTLSKLNSLSNSFVGTSPSWMKISPDGKFLYSANEVKDMNLRKNSGSLSSYRIFRNTSESNLDTSLIIEPMNQVFTSANPVSSEATARRYELDDDKSFKSNQSVQTFTYNASGPIISRQSQSHLHQARYDPTGRIAAFVDLGGDRVYLHSVDRKTGELTPIQTLQLEPGTGPRHLTFFSVNEARIDINHLSTPNFSIEIKQTLNTLPPTIQNQTTFGAGEVAITQDGKFVYGTNRQTEFKEPKEDNNFNQSFLVVIGQQENLVGIYKGDFLSGKITFLDMIRIDEPAYVEFV